MMFRMFIIHGICRKMTLRRIKKSADRGRHFFLQFSQLLIEPFHDFYEIVSRSLDKFGV